jgi:hypothetical protein
VKTYRDGQEVRLNDIVRTERAGRDSIVTDLDGFDGRVVVTAFKPLSGKQKNPTPDRRALHPTWLNLRSRDGSVDALREAARVEGSQRLVGTASEKMSDPPEVR